VTGAVTGVVAGPFALACALLVVAGGAKAWSARRLPPKLFGVMEVGVGTAAFVHQSALVTVLVAALYAGFVVVAGRAKARQRACGCFGADERLPTTGHVALNAALALSALAALAATTSPAAYLGFTYAVLLGTATYLGVAVMTA
jgi:hypothetical protein